jgi:glycerol-3-phosphate acyltransferase PlsY
MTEPWITVGLGIGGYLAGSIPFGVLISRMLGAVDPRTAGSRNIGFTNVLRVGGKTAGILTLTGDIAKGWIVAALAVQLIQSWPVALAIAATPVLGHLFPVFLSFHGGKGVATAFGVLVGVRPGVGWAVVAIWLLTAAVWRYSSGAAVAAFALLPLVVVVARGDLPFVVFSVILSLVILARHRGNIQRLWQGNEPKIGQRAA